METRQGEAQVEREAEVPSPHQALDKFRGKLKEGPATLTAGLSRPEEATEQQQQQEGQQQKQQEDEVQKEKGEEHRVWPKQQQHQQARQQQLHHQQEGLQQQQQQVFSDVPQRQPFVGEVEALTQQLALLQKLIEEGRGTTDMQQLLAAASAAAAPLPLAADNSSGSTADGVRLTQPRRLPTLPNGARGPPGPQVSHEGIPQQQQQQGLVVQEAVASLETCSVRGGSLGCRGPPLGLRGPPDTVWPVGRQSYNSMWRPSTGPPPPGFGGPFEGGVSYQEGPPYRGSFLSHSPSRSFFFGGRGAVTPQGGNPMPRQPNFPYGSPNGLRSPLQAEDEVFGGAFVPARGPPYPDRGSLLSAGESSLMGPPGLLHLGAPHSASNALAGHPENPGALGVGAGPPPPSLDSLDALLSRDQQQQQRRGPRGMGGVGPHSVQSAVPRRSPPRAKSVYFFCPSCLESFPASSLSLFAAHISQEGHRVQQLQRLRGSDGYYRCPKCTCKGSDLLGLLRHWQEGGAAHHGQKILKHIRASERPFNTFQPPVAFPSISRLQQRHQLPLLHQHPQHQQQHQQQQMLLLQEAGVGGAHPLQGRSRRQDTRGGDSEVSPSQYPFYPVGPHHLRAQEAPHSDEGPSISHGKGSFPPHIAQDGWRGSPLLREVRGPPSQPSVRPPGVDFRSGSISQKSSGPSDEASDESLLQTQQQQQEQLQHQQREEALRCLMGLRLGGSSGAGEVSGVSGGGPRSSSPLTEEPMKAVPFRRGFRGFAAPPFFAPRLQVVPEGARLSQVVSRSFEEGASCESENGRVAPARGPRPKGVWGTPRQHFHEQQRDIRESQPLQQQQQQQQQQQERQLGVSSTAANFLGDGGLSSALQQPAVDRSDGLSSVESPFVWANPSEPRGGS
ncbi:hypothetical protein ACSSS7_000548 [Eimeria intestinalis]